MSDLPRYPDTTGKDVTKRIDELENYIINLHRFLRFALETIDETNMTTGARGQFLEIKGLYAELYADETGLLSRMTNAEGSVSTLQQNVNGLTSTVQANTGDISDLQGDVSDAESDISTLGQNMSTLTQTVQGFSLDVTNVEGSVSTLQQNVNGLTSTVQDVEGNLSTLTQTVNGFSLDVTNGSTSSVIKLKSGSTEISSQNISMSGLVKFTDLSTTGSTTINGSNITTGSITAVDISGVSIFGCTIEGGSLKSLGVAGNYDLRIKNGRLDWLMPNTEDAYYATIACSQSNGLTFGTDAWINMYAVGTIKIKSDYNMSINAGDGFGIYIGGDTGTTQSINIGNSNSTVNIKGTVKVNGATLPY